ncbi:MAG: DNA-binding protein WhiA [Butyrivibrio sp.]|jgi:DNA-binding protein WhiA|nr:DNA-binding protein WhiA [Butyrivibrio sp.]
MSFSGEVKEELVKHTGTARHCLLAELAAIMTACGSVSVAEDGDMTLFLQTENELVVRKCFTILKKAFNIDTDILVVVPEKHENGRIYKPFLDQQREVRSVLMALRMLDEAGQLRKMEEGVNPMLVRNSCCKRAFLRDSFLCIGSMSDPRKSYHLEYVCSCEKHAEDLQSLLKTFDIEAKMVRRKKYFVVYLKEGSEIVDLLNVMEAHVSLMNLENLRIYKEMRNSVNRRVNCEAANITKTVTAASKQTEDIIYIQKHYGFNNLQDNLRQMAEVRLQYPEATLQELGHFLDPPVGKSGVNHRLRKLSELADRIRS